MDIHSSERTKKIQPSPTLAMNARAKAMQQAGADIISLGVGEPDFDTPDHIKQAAITAINQGATKYTAVDGIPELKQAIISKFAHDNQLTYSPEQILVSSGAKHAIYNAAQALLNPGDEVIIPCPYWVSYPDIVTLCDAKPIFVQSNYAQQFKITPEALAKAITPKTKMLFLNSPSNPSGMIYSKSELEKIADVLLEHPDIIILTDDIYEQIIWPDQTFYNIVMVCPQLYERTLVINGISKTYAMTGWRIGYTAGNKSIISAMRKVQSQSTSNPCSISQKAAVEAIAGDQHCITEMVRQFKQRHDMVVQTLNSIPGIQCHASNGTFYVLPDVTQLIEQTANVDSDLALAELWLTKIGVATVPGTAFGAPGCIRFSIATSMDKLTDALERIKSLV